MKAAPSDIIGTREGATQFFVRIFTQVGADSETAEAMQHEARSATTH